MTIKTNLAFGDILRLSCGVAHTVLQHIADAGKEKAYMEFALWCWDGEITPTIENLLQWTALGAKAIYEKVGLDAHGNPIIDKEDYWDEDDDYVYTRDAEDVYC